MLVSKICLTGGPCAGKTTALSKIEQELSDVGYKVFIINEVATNLINAKIKPFGEDKYDLYEFERIMLKHQLLEEESFERVSNYLDKKCVIICDRGVFDIKSFLTNKEFDKLLKEENVSKLNLMDSYNAVIHMTTAAKGKEQFYTSENNKARSEDVSEARVRDEKCEQAWSFHNNLRIIDNSTNFDDKISRVIDYIKECLKIEKRNVRKYLIEVNDDLYKYLNEKGSIKVDILQTYLETNDDYEMRLRKRTLDGEETYYVTAKKSYEGKETIITEEKIDKKTYLRLMSQRNVVNQIAKQRTCFVYDDNWFKLDEFDGGTVILEASFDALLPPFLKVLKDVTKDEDYKNINMVFKKKTHAKRM